MPRTNQTKVSPQTTLTQGSQSDSLTTRGGKMIKAFGYIRVSTTLQAEYGYSLEAQRSMIKNYAAALGYQVIQFYCDTDSAKDVTGRPKYQEMMRRVEKGECRLVISACLDRFTRSLLDFMNFTNDYIKTDRCHLILIQESINTMSAMGRQILPLLVALAQLERERTSERVKTTIAHIKSQGGHYGKVPFGYMTIEGENGLKKLVRNPNTYKWVETMQAWYQSGVDFATIAQRLNENGVKPAYSAKWTKTAVYDYLVNQGIHKIRSLKSDRQFEPHEAKRLALELEAQGLTQKQIANRLNEMGYRPKKASRYEWYSVQTLLNDGKSYNLRDAHECALAYRDKGLPLLAVGQKLLEHGHRPKRGGAWHATTVANLLTRSRKCAA